MLAFTPALFAQTPVAIVTQPANRTVTVGATASFSVVATGNPAPAYQWRKNGVNVANATAATYTTPVTIAADNGSIFSVVVSNSAGPSRTSNGATLTVNALPNVNVTGPGGVAAGQTATFTAVATGGTPPFTYQWYKGGTLPANLIPGATSATYVTPPTTIADDGSRYFVRITDASGISVFSAQEDLTVFKTSQTITFTAPTNAVVSPSPIILSATASSGLPVSFLILSGPAAVVGSNVILNGVGNVGVRAFQVGNAIYDAAPFVDRTFAVGKGTPVITWTPPASVPDGTTLGSAQLNATANVPGSFVYAPPGGTIVRAPSQTLTVSFTPTDTVNYNSASAQRTLAVGAALDVARLTNVSVRTTLAASQTLIVGFTMQGGEKAVLLRAVGPTLNQFGVAVPMTDPRLALFKETSAVEANDNWGGGGALAGAFARVGAFPLPAASMDAALMRTIEGGHTAQVSGPAGTVLVEVYDVGTGNSPRLSNVSARNRAGTGNDVLIAGFTVDGSGQKNLLFRAVGPALAGFGVSGPLADPKLEIYTSSGTKVAENDTWSASLAGTFGTVGAFALTPGSRDAALTIMLPAGGYTVQVSGADGGTGEALVEVYELP